jgi:preprotein translocase SecE subunit
LGEAIKVAKKDTRKTDEKVVTRVKAADTRDDEKVVKKTKDAEAKAPKEKKALPNPIKATGGYFVGAWRELQQVRWPNRRATWSLTAAMLAFTAFFVVLILLLDALFKYVFQLILG